MRKFINQVFFTLLILSNILLSQEKDLEKEKNKLIDLAQVILKGETDSIRIAANDDFYENLLTLLNTEKSYKYKFENIEHVSILQPKDKMFKIFTWFLPYKNGEYEYFGIIQKCKKNGNKCRIYELKKTQELNNESLNKNLETDEWYGCLYYDIISITINKQKYYTLLGWDGNNKQTTKKIIEVLKLKKKTDPVFGSSIFNNTQKRIIIEYSSKYPISLRYDEKLEYIVFDHIEPIDGISINNFDIYAPNLSYDIFKKTDMGWELETNIYLNNEK